MKKLGIAVLFYVSAQTAMAGGYSDPVVEPVMAPVVIEDAAQASSAPSAGLVLALTTLIIMGVGVASGG